MKENFGAGGIYNQDYNANDFNQDFDQDFEDNNFDNNVADEADLGKTSKIKIKAKMLVTTLELKQNSEMHGMGKLT